MTRKPVPPYRKIKDALLRRIKDGVYPAGTVLPAELELAEAFGVARATVHRAVRELAEDGLVERKRKGGTRVLPSPVREARFQIPIIRTEIEAQGAIYEYRLLAQAVAAPAAAIASRMGLEAGVEALHLICLHLADGKPYQLEDRWISLSSLPQARNADFSAVGPNEWLVRTVPYSDVELSLSAEVADAQTARLLGAQAGDAVLVSQRVTRWRGKAITHVRMIFSPGYSLTARY